MKYIKTKYLKQYLNNKPYSSISITGSVYGMKKQFGWDKAKEIIKSGSYYYAIY